jgi:hypothetical protein
MTIKAGTLKRIHQLVVPRKLGTHTKACDEPT